MKHIKLLLFTSLFILLNACGSSSSTDSDLPPEKPENTSLQISCVGDSITEGTGLSNPTIQSYPAQLATMVDDGSSAGNFGVKSATLLKNGSYPYWNTSKFEPSHSFNPDVVVIMLGTNDAKPNNWVNKDKFVSDYTDLINSYKNLDSRPIVYICYPPPLYAEVAGITDLRIRAELIPLIQQVATNNDVAVIDIYSALTNQKALFPDKIHPNAAGARIIAETIYQVIY